MTKEDVLDSVSYVTAVLPIVVGITVWIGWFTNQHALVQLHPSFVAMQFNTAMCFIFCGVGTLMLLRKVRKELVLLVSGFVFLFTFLTLLQYLFRLNFQIDEIFMKHEVTVGTSAPGRMAMNTAFCFMLYSLGLIFLTNLPKYFHIIGFCSGLVFIISLVVLFGYFFRIERLYGWASFTEMALHTASNFLLLSVAQITLFRILYSNNITPSIESNKNWILGFIVAMMIGNFIVDVDTPLGVSLGILYIPVLLLSMYLDTSRYQLFLISVSCGLILLGYFYSDKVSSYSFPLANRMLSIFAVGITGILLYNLRKINRSLSHQQEQVFQSKILIESLESKNEELEQFAYIASHDLQEPLRTVSNYMTVIKEDYQENLNEELVGYLERIEKAVDRMRLLIKSILDYSRLGKKTQLNKISLNKIVNDVINDLNQSILTSGAILEINELPELTVNDTEMRLVFQNLISNAVKFCKQDEPPRIKISALEKGDHWLFSIKDHGIGLSMKYANKIFKIFQQIDSKKRHQGYGIGLAHSRRIIELHEGKIWVDSEEGQGCTFYFTLPKKNRYRNEETGKTQVYNAG